MGCLCSCVGHSPCLDLLGLLPFSSLGSCFSTVVPGRHFWLLLFAGCSLTPSSSWLVASVARGWWTAAVCYAAHQQSQQSKCHQEDWNCSTAAAGTGLLHGHVPQTKSWAHAKTWTALREYSVAQLPRFSSIPPPQPRSWSSSKWHNSSTYSYITISSPVIVIWLFVTFLCTLLPFFPFSSGFVNL